MRTESLSLSRSSCGCLSSERLPSPYLRDLCSEENVECVISSKGTSLFVIARLPPLRLPRPYTCCGDNANSPSSTQANSSACVSYSLNILTADAQTPQFESCGCQAQRGDLMNIQRYSCFTGDASLNLALGNYFFHSPPPPLYIPPFISNAPFSPTHSLFYIFFIFIPHSFYFFLYSPCTCSVRRHCGPLPSKFSLYLANRPTLLKNT